MGKACFVHCPPGLSFEGVTQCETSIASSCNIDHTQILHFIFIQHVTQ